MDNWMVGVRTLWQSKVVLFLVFLSFLVAVNAQVQIVDSALAQIPQEDRDKISYFFRHAIFWDAYGYVLLGDKPCAISSYKQITWNPVSWLEYFSPHNLKMRRGWKTWRKYEQLFPHPQFVFVEEDSLTTRAHFVILIRRDAFLQKVCENQKDFQAILHRVSGADFLVEAEEGSLLNQVLKNHDGLIGTLLGYGRNNAWNFHNGSKQLQPFVDEGEQLRTKNFCREQGAWKFFTGSFDRDFSYLLLPGFAVDPNDPETRSLKYAYSCSRDEIIDRYREKDFLTTTLRLLCSVQER